MIRRAGNAFFLIAAHVNRMISLATALKPEPNCLQHLNKLTNSWRHLPRVCVS